MVAYCVGLGLPFVVLAFALESTRPLVRVINSHRRGIDLLSAAVLLAMGLLLLTNKLAVLSAGITQPAPSWASPPPLRGIPRRLRQLSVFTARVSRRFCPTSSSS